MASKDQTIGGIICLVCVIVGVLYAMTLLWPAWLDFALGKNARGSTQFWVVAIPVLIAFIAIMGIGAWIGWTMATTPPPKPIEEITSEIETEQKATEEEAAQETAPPQDEEKKTEKKRRTE